MTIGAADALPIDTNTLVYLTRAPLHEQALAAIREYERSAVELWTSRQILREYLAVLSRPQIFTDPVTVRTLVEQVRSFESRFQVAEDGPQVTARPLTLIQRVPVGGRQINDANICRPESDPAMVTPQ